MNILIIKFRNIGDVLLTAPLASALHANGHRVTALVKEGTQAMLEGLSDLEAVLVYPARQPGESRIAYLLREMAFYRGLRSRHFDLAINTTEGDRGVIASFLSGAPRRRGLVTPGRGPRWRLRLINEVVNPSPGRRHTVLRNLDMGAPETAEVPISVTLQISSEDRNSVLGLLQDRGYRPDRPLIHIHPTSRWFFKCWTDEGMAAVIDHLVRENMQVVLSCGPDPRERKKLDAILSRCTQQPIDLGGHLSLKQTAALSSLATLFFGVDTAPMHMAAAAGTPVVAIFGPSGVFDWGPWPNGWSSQQNPYPGVSGHQTAGPHRVIQQNWPCVPCGKDGCNGSKRSECLERTEVAQVIPVLDDALEKAVQHCREMNN